MTEQFVNEVLPEKCDGQARRAAKKFALVGAAGELATYWGITGWGDGSATDDAKKCFQAWLKARGGTDNAEKTQMLRQAKLFFDLHGESRFTLWNEGGLPISERSQKTLNRCGFKKMEPISNSDGTARSLAPPQFEATYYVLSAPFTEEVCKGFNSTKVCKLLHECGALERDTEAYSVSVRLPGGGKTKQRVYKIKPHLIPAGGDEPE